MKKCLDEGILKNYLDGELSPEMMKSVATHLAECAPCAAAARAAESELAIFAAAFAPDPSVSVPTAQLRARIETAIAASHHSSLVEPAAPLTNLISRLRAWLAALTAVLTIAPQRTAAFASLAAIIAFAAVFALVQSRISTTKETRDTTEIVTTTQTESPGKTVTTPQPAAGSATEEQLAKNSDAESSVEAAVAAPPRMARASHGRRPRLPRASSPPLLARADKKNATSGDVLLPGEESYLKAIASLTAAIEVGADIARRPTLRAEYESNLAVVDQAINATRRTVLRNPKDAAAKEFLLSAYQSKVELLSAVADQAQVATLSGR